MQERFQIGEYWLSQVKPASTWHITWYDKAARQTRRKSLGISDFESAKTKLAQWVLTLGKRELTATSDAALATVLTRYVHQHAPRIKASGEARRAVELFSQAAMHCNVATVDDLILKNQHKIFDFMKNKGRSQSYIKRIFGVAKAAVNWSWENGELERPIPFIRINECTQEKYKVLSSRELADLWHTDMPSHLRMFLRIMLATGARPAAILDLTLASCDLDTGVIDFNPPGRIRTAKRRPMLPIANFLLASLKSSPPGPLVQWRGAPMKKINKTWRTIREQAALPDYIVPYAIRHTLATEMARRNVPPIELAMWFGHKEADTRTTARYMHFRPDYLKTACLAVEDFVSTIGLSD
ncbi:tyrosine-type recombinase/integrase [Acetobacter thailandicus]|nr:tyrosine-type recombinase/integrase [Acetobacter thailandicus]MBS0961144.1 tyrosine-type recombinase/integrase [Acetobacter thailandicus]